MRILLPILKKAEVAGKRVILDTKLIDAGSEKK
jgi:hypothetical protein